MKLGRRAEGSGPGHEVGAAAEHEVVKGEGRLGGGLQSCTEMAHQQWWRWQGPQPSDRRRIEEGGIFEKDNLGLKAANRLKHIGLSCIALA